MVVADPPGEEPQPVTTSAASAVSAAAAATKPRLLRPPAPRVVGRSGLIVTSWPPEVCPRILGARVPCGSRAPRIYSAVNLRVNHLSPTIWQARPGFLGPG